jgi:tRNA threonylcarbamoyladenosine biosynthesis protein TsaE
MDRSGVINLESAEETVAFGQAFAAYLKPGNVVCFFGELGTGKTTLIKGIVQALTDTDPKSICSPTFAYLNIYQGEKTVFHFDLYRLDDVEDFLSLGFEEYLLADGICCIEWSERIEPILPDHAIRIHLVYSGQDKRKISYEIPKRPLSDNSCAR